MMICISRIYYGSHEERTTNLFLNQVTFAELETAARNVAVLQDVVYYQMLNRFTVLSVPDDKMYLGLEVQELGFKHLADQPIAD